MSTESAPTLTLDDIAQRLGLSRGRISQLRKESPTFPSPTKRSIRRAEWSADEIAEWARAAGYAYQGEDSQHGIDQFWGQAPGSFRLVDARVLHGAAVLQYKESTMRVAVIFSDGRLTPAQVKSAGTKSGADWVIEVTGHYGLRSPVVKIWSADRSSVGESSLESVGERLGVTLPQYVGSGSEEGVLLSALAETTLELSPKPSLIDLHPAYRLYAKSPDVDVQAAAAHLIGEVEGSEGDNFHVSHLNEHGEGSGGAIRIGSTMSQAGMVSPGDAAAGFRAMMSSRPVDDDVIRALVAAQRYGIGVIPDVATVITHESAVTADLIASTWSQGDPISGHSMLLREVSSGWPGADQLTFYRNQSAGELAVITGNAVTMTRHIVPGRSVAHVVFVADEGVMYLDDAGHAFAPTYHQNIGYRSGQEYAAVLIARELGIKGSLDGNALTKALAEGAIELNKPIATERIRSLLEARN